MTDQILEAFAPLLAGTCTVERELGRGGMGVVYLAREVRLDRQVAIRVLPPHLAGRRLQARRRRRAARPTLGGLAA